MSVNRAIPPSPLTFPPPDFTKKFPEWLGEIKNEADGTKQAVIAHSESEKAALLKKYPQFSKAENDDEEDIVLPPVTIKRKGKE